MKSSTQKQASGSPSTRSHINWGGEQNIIYKRVETYP